jgi:inner membrane protein
MGSAQYMSRVMTGYRAVWTITPMDSLSQVALGAAVGVAVMGRRTKTWKAAAWGAAAGTMPDLDVFISHGDPILNMVLHRAETHALFWLTLFSLPLAAAVARLQGEWAIWRRWWLALWLVLITHPLLDTMTVYGTQLGLPFTDHPYAVGSVFIIDPLYTLPLLAGGIWALATRGAGLGLTANTLGLVLSTAYLAWGVVAQQQVTQVARSSLAAHGIEAEHLLVTPTAFNTVLWRIVAVDGDDFHEGFYSLLDRQARVDFDRFARGRTLLHELQDIDGVRRMAAFSKGLFKLEQIGPRFVLSDLRMGQEPDYVFRFAVAERQSPLVPLIPAQQIGTRMDLERGLPWLWRRAQGEPVPPPR